MFEKTESRKIAGMNPSIFSGVEETPTRESSVTRSGI